MNKIFSLFCETLICIYYVILVIGSKTGLFSINNGDLAFLIMLGFLSIINYLKGMK